MYHYNEAVPVWCIFMSSGKLYSCLHINTRLQTKLLGAEKERRLSCQCSSVYILLTVTLRVTTAERAPTIC